jgi:hypothetical protein
MRKSVMNTICAGLMLTLAGIASAADFQGVLMDKMCSAKAVSGGQKAAAEHTTECALMPNCQKSGYGVFTADNEFLAFDQAGNEKALQALRGAKKKDNLKIRVSGKLEGGTIKVSSIELL